MIPAPQSETKINEIINEINKFKNTWLFTEFDLRRLKKEAEKVKSTSLTYGFSLQGMIAALENDIEAMHSFFKRALQQSGEGRFELCNYVSALLISNLCEDAYKYALRAYPNDPSDLISLGVLIEALAATNRKAEFKKYADLWRKNTKEDHLRAKIPGAYMRGEKKEIGEFIEQHSEISKIISESGPELIRFFDAPLIFIAELMPNTHHELNLVAWIQCTDEVEDGMEKFFHLEEWYIEQGFDLKTDLFCFNIEFVEQL
ncbi:MAG: hypothetical protein GY749_28690 [Desulfobacteraceae bacterium]|nr:hypothetical protein [Desulfobacteraceae bacterium]